MSFARWQPYYTDRELELDRRIHAFGLLLALIATPLLLGLAAESRRPGLAAFAALASFVLFGLRPTLVFAAVLEGVVLVPG